MFRFVTAIALIAAIAAIAASSSRASAQAASAQAEALFREGRELMAAGKTADACNAFAESQKLEPATTTLLNLAACHEKLGQFATAWGFFVDAARQTRSASDPPSRQMHAVATDHATKLENRISKLTINVPQGSQIDGLELSRDKERIDALMWNRALPIDGGTYTISAHAPGTTTWTTQITVAPERDTKTVDIPELPAMPRAVVQAKPAETSVAVRATPPPPTPAPVLAAQPSVVAPIVVSVGAVALLGGSLGLETWAVSTYNDAKAEMKSQVRRDSLANSATDRRYAAEGVAVAGVAAAGVAVWLWTRYHGERSMVVTTARHVVVSPTGFAVIGGF